MPERPLQSCQEPDTGPRPRGSGPAPLNTVDILIVGAGFAGLGMAIALRKAGNDSFLVIEKGDDVGGTWRENIYPGCACDIPSHLYSFSFDLNPEWTRMYAGQEEIWNYLRVVAKKYGVLPRIQFNTAFREAEWDEARETWHVTTSDGEQIEARVLISGMGALHVPRYPELAGLEKFQGPLFHSAAWDRHATLEGRNIAVIGTGASSVQFVPEIAPAAQKLYLFQRTAAWILPRADFPMPERWRRRFRTIPGAMRLFRTLLFWSQEMRLPSFLGNRWMRRKATQIALHHLEKRISHPALRAALTPNYEFGCKRVLISSDFYPTLTRPNVELVTAPITEIREHSIVTADGAERPVDVLICGTGFHATVLLHGARIIGRGGADLQTAWSRRSTAYLGVTVSGFPNLFLLLGPHTGLGHNSVVLMIEAQIRYVMSCLRLMQRKKTRSMEVRPESVSRFADFLRSKLPGTVWQSGGCRSWYQTAAGENPSIWPASVTAYQRRTRHASAPDFLFGKQPVR